MTGIEWFAVGVVAFVILVVVGLSMYRSGKQEGKEEAKTVVEVPHAGVPAVAGSKEQEARLRNTSSHPA